jgi:hypothetical protein
VPNITVSGPFKGASYLDKSVDPPVTRTGEANDLVISKATDSVYQVRVRGRARGRVRARVRRPTASIR